MPDQPHGVSFVTPLGCTVWVLHAPEHLGEGVLLTLSVDTRYAEVYLDPESMRRLRAALS
jgi:ABC-type uncharacterized transport system ATPase subunit